MTGNNLLLDTNIVIEAFADNKNITKRMNEYSDFSISAIVLGELYIGINRVVNKAKHLQKLESFLKLCDIIDINHNTAILFGEITAALQKIGKPIPANDVWIAATAKQHNLTLVSRDKHFNEISSLKLENW